MNIVIVRVRALWMHDTKRAIWEMNFPFQYRESFFYSNIAILRAHDFYLYPTYFLLERWNANSPPEWHYSTKVRKILYSAEQDWSQIGMAPTWAQDEREKGSSVECATQFRWLPFAFVSEYTYRVSQFVENANRCTISGKHFFMSFLWSTDIL